MTAMLCLFLSCLAYVVRGVALAACGARKCRACRARYKHSLEAPAAFSGHRLGTPRLPQQPGRRCHHHQERALPHGPLYNIFDDGGHNGGGGLVVSPSACKQLKAAEQERANDIRHQAPPAVVLRCSHGSCHAANSKATATAPPSGHVPPRQLQIHAATFACGASTA